MSLNKTFSLYLFLLFNFQPKFYLTKSSSILVKFSVNIKTFVFLFRLYLDQIPIIISYPCNYEVMFVMLCLQKYQMGPTLKVFCNYCIVDFHVRDRPFTLGPQEHSYDGDLGLLLYYLDTTKLLFSPYFRYGLEHSSSRLHQACRREIIFVLSRMINEFLIQLSSSRLLYTV